MSVELMVLGKSGTNVKVHVPIASQHAYHGIFVPLAATLKLVWLPLFETGLTVKTEDVAEVIEEFKRFKDELARDPASIGFIARIDGVIETLEDYLGRDDVEVWIG